MFTKKVKYQLARVRDFIKPKFAKINVGMIFGALFYILLMTVLAVNGYTAYQRGIENLQKYDQEQAATNVLLQENSELQDLYRYYNSIDYKMIYARDNLGLAQSGETLYSIEKNQPIDVETINTNTPPRTVNNLSLWSKLLFGV